MPRILLNHTVSGVGSTGINIDNVLVIPSAGSPAWVSSAQIIGNAQPSGDTEFRVVTIDPITHTMSVLWPGEPGSDTCMAGNGVIAAGLRSATPFTRLVNDKGRTTLNGLIPFDVDRETGLVVMREYALGQNIQLVPRDAVSPAIVVPTGPIYDARSVGNLVTWSEGTSNGVRPRCYSYTAKQEISVQAAQGNVYQPLVITSKTGKLFLLYSGQEGEVWCHPILDTTKGHSLPAGNHFYLDGEVQPDGFLRVVWGGNQGETAGVEGTVSWDLVNLETLTMTAGPPSSGVGELPGDGGGAGSASGEVTTTGKVLTSTGYFDVAGAAEELVTLPVEVWPAYPVESGPGRIVHPTLGAFDYQVKPDEWVNIDANAIITPMWSSTRTLTSAANVLWSGNIRDVVIEERWKGQGGLSMPVTQFRMLLAIWTTPMDPDVGYVRWYPTYITNVGFQVLPVMLTSGGQGITFDDVVNYKDEDGDPIGWMTNPVVFTLKLVAKL